MAYRCTSNSPHLPWEKSAKFNLPILVWRDSWSVDSTTLKNRRTVNRDKLLDNQSGDTLDGSEIQGAADISQSDLLEFIYLEGILSGRRTNFAWSSSVTR